MDIPKARLLKVKIRVESSVYRRWLKPNSGYDPIHALPSWKNHYKYWDNDTKLFALAVCQKLKIPFDI